MKLDSTLEAPSHSRLAKLHDCRRAYGYRYVMGLRSRGSQSTKSLGGKAGHAALDTLHRLGWEAREIADNHIDAIFSEHVSNPEWLTAEHMKGIIGNYIERYADEDDDFRRLRLNADDVLKNEAVLYSDLAGRVADDGSFSMNEMNMVVQLDDKLKMTLVLDMLVERKDGTVWVADHKFTAQYLGQGVLGRYITSKQMPLYILAARKLVGRCDGAILNAVWMGQAACNPASKATKFDRYYFDYTEGQLEEALEWAALSRGRAQSETNAFGFNMEYWPQNPSSYCSGCDYLQLCEVAPAMRPGRITQWYDLAEAEVEDAE